jgi:hypothetical protein
MARKPLYLSTREPVGVGAESECLVLRRVGGQKDRFPFARIDRIVCNRHANWSGEALAACLARAIPVTWVDGRGNALGAATPRLAKPGPITHLLENYVELPDWPMRYGDWLRRRRMNVMRAWIAQAALDGTQPGRERVESIKRSYVYNAEIEDTFPEIAHAWCHGLVVRRLTQEALQPRYWGYDGHPLELAEHLTQLLWAELNLSGGTVATAIEGTRELMLLFETWVRRNEGRLLAHLGDLKRHLASASETWH